MSAPIARGVLVGPQGFEIGEVLLATTGPLVLDKRFASDNRNEYAFNPALHPFVPRRIESDSGKGCHNVDAKRRQAELRHVVRIDKICGGDSERLEWSAKTGERLEHPLSVFRVRPDPDVEIDGRARNSVRAECMRANDQEACIRREQLLEHIAEIRYHRLAARVLSRDRRLRRA